MPTGDGVAVSIAQDGRGKEECVVPIVWSELKPQEQMALKRMNRGPYPGLDKALAERLIELGLAKERAGGVGISRAGRELVIDMLLRARADPRG